jgi:hypothetical protein
VPCEIPIAAANALEVPSSAIRSRIHSVASEGVPRAVARTLASSSRAPVALLHVVGDPSLNFRIRVPMGAAASPSQRGPTWRAYPPRRRMRTPTPVPARGPEETRHAQTARPSEFVASRGAHAERGRLLAVWWPRIPSRPSSRVPSPCGGTCSAPRSGRGTAASEGHGGISTGSWGRSWLSSSWA